MVGASGKGKGLRKSVRSNSLADSKGSASRSDPPMQMTGIWPMAGVADGRQARSPLHMGLLAAAAFVLLVVLLLWRRAAQRARFSLSDRVVVITGGARGLGKQLAATLLTSTPRSTVVLVDIDEAALEATQRELLRPLTRVSSSATSQPQPLTPSPEDGGEDVRRVYSFKCDVSKESAVRSCVKAIAEAVAPKRISVLINNAGIVTGKSIDVLTPEEVRRTFEVNTLGQIWMIQSVLPLLKQSPDGGLIVSVASVMGLISGANLADYCGSKAAVSAFHDCLRLELWRDGFSKIRTLLVCPNAVDTGMFQGIMAGSDWTAWLSRLLLPTTREADAARRIVDAMAGGEQFVVSCYTGWRGLVVPWLPSVARLLPVAWFDRVVYLGGGVHGMDTFVGREKKET